MATGQASGTRLKAWLAAGLLLCAGAMTNPPDAAGKADLPGEPVWTSGTSDKLGHVVRQSQTPPQEAPGMAAFHAEAGRHPYGRPVAAAPKPVQPKIVDLRLSLLAPLKFAANYVDVYIWNGTDPSE